ncbi:MAG: hypothetical protein K0U20_09305 [Proteobacteria bacterium]|nr:hypothetical protein [Pseudomonadota bacterium]MCH9735777.1 hypothetical protein [Actinomycetes bacterium]
MTYNLVIDADSILYTSCYRNQDIELLHWFPELAYKDFVSTVSNIESSLYKQFDLQSEDKIETEIIFSPKKTFRNELSEAYKAKRKPTTIIGIPELKQMVSIRLGMTQGNNIEADDLVITRAKEKENVVIACIDKDIFTHTPVPCFNYKKWEWVEVMEDSHIEREYYKQALIGDSTDGISGAKGIGAKNKIFKDGTKYWNWDEYKTFFETDEEALLSMRLVRMDQYSTKEGLQLWQNQ